MMDMKEALRMYYAEIMKAFIVEFPECHVSAYDANRSIDLEEKADCEIDLVSWDEVKDADWNDCSTRLRCEWEIRFLDKTREEINNLAVHVRSFAMRAHMLVRKNRWGLDFVGLPAEIRCADDKIDETLNKEECWLVSFSQEIAVGEEEEYYDPKLFEFYGESRQAGMRIEIDTGKKKDLQ